MRIGILTSIIFGAILVQMAVLLLVAVSRRKRESQKTEEERETPDV